MKVLREGCSFITLNLLKISGLMPLSNCGTSLEGTLASRNHLMIRLLLNFNCFAWSELVTLQRLKSVFVVDDEGPLTPVEISPQQAITDDLLDILIIKGHRVLLVKEFILWVWISDYSDQVLGP